MQARSGSPQVPGGGGSWGDRREATARRAGKCVGPLAVPGLVNTVGPLPLIPLRLLPVGSSPTALPSPSEILSEASSCGHSGTFSLGKASCHLSPWLHLPNDLKSTRPQKNQATPASFLVIVNRIMTSHLRSCSSRPKTYCASRTASVPQLCDRHERETKA